MTSTSIAKTTRMPPGIVKGIRYRTRREGVDESTALRQLLRYGLKEYAVQLYKQGQISLREASELSDVTVRDMIDLLAEHGVKGNIQSDTQKKSLEIVRYFQEFR